MDRLGLVAGMCKELYIAEHIDQRAPKTSDDWKASHGEAVVGMIINRPGLTDQFHHMFSQFFADKPLNKLIREGIESEQLNDKVIERTLDELFEADVSKAYFELAIKAPGFISPSTKPIRHQQSPSEKKTLTRRIQKKSLKESEKLDKLREKPFQCKADAIEAPSDSGKKHPCIARLSQISS